jgi:prepilin-type N-terminal cleavage/methylation domain-containing protein
VLTRLRRAFPHTRSAADAESGFTLIELLVVVGIMSIIGTIVSGTIIQSMQASRREQERVFTVSTAQTALERLSRDLRTSDPLVAANLNDVSMLVYRSGHCELRRWWVDTQAQLLSSITRYTDASTSCATRSGGTDTPVTQVVMDNAGVDSTTLIFRYYTKNPNSALTEVTAPVPTNQLTRIDRAELTIKGLLRENGAPVFLTSSIDLRNVEQLP